MSKKIFIFLAVIIFFASYLFSAARDTSKMPLYKDEVLVTYKAEFTQADRDALASKYKMTATTREDIIKFIETTYNIVPARAYLPKSFFICYKLQGTQDMESVVKSLQAEPVIEQAQPNYLFYTQNPYYNYTTITPPDDNYYTTKSQWYINQIRADEVCNTLVSSFTPQKNVIVAVVDTGVGIPPDGHEDLEGVMVTGVNILDRSIQPWDDNGHGTHVAGIIAAQTNNAVGMAGVAGFYYGVTLGVKIMPVKIMNSVGGGTEADLCIGIYWAADNGADIINISVGGDSAGPSLKTAVNYAYDKGCLLIAAAGNSDTQTFYPAAYSNVMAVAASDMLLDSCGSTYDARAIFPNGSKSNWGKIDIAAPGVDIFSMSNDNYTAYTADSGTSFSSPIVAGVAAMIKIKYPGYTNDQIRSVIEQTADDDYHICSGTGIQGYDKYFGWGRVNEYRALKLDTNIVNNTDTIKTYNWPNPFSPDNDGYTRIIFTIGTPQKLTLAIYDGGGELVWDKTLQAAEVTSGIQNTVKWDGKNREGKKVAIGTYFYVIKTDGGKYGKNKIAVYY